jgi:hypothetical protein
MLDAQRAAGSALAGRLLADHAGLVADTWLVEPVVDGISIATPAPPTGVSPAVPAPVGA